MGTVTSRWVNNMFNEGVALSGATDFDSVVA